MPTGIKTGIKIFQFEKKMSARIKEFLKEE